MLALIAHKPLISLIIFICTLIGGFLPVSFRMSDGSRFIAGTVALTRGLFLGLALIHFFPEALASLAQRDSNLQFSRFAAEHAALCAATLISIIIAALIYFEHHLRRQEQVNHLLAYMVLIMLSLHSFFAGFALGMETTAAGILMIFLVIVSHKSFEAFALGVKLRIAALPRATTLWLLLLFALMTPMGIFLGIYLQQHQDTLLSIVADAALHVFLTGLFIYLALFENTHDHGHAPVQNAILFAVGFVGFSLLSWGLAG